MLGEISGVYCLRKRRVLAVASDSSGFATAVLSEVASRFELSIWLHVYGMVKVGTHEFGSHPQGKYIDSKSTQVIWNPCVRKLCVVVDGLCTLMSYSWEDPATGVGTSMLKAIKSTNEGLDTDFPPTGDFVNVKISTICEVPHHIISACLGDNLHSIYLGMTGAVAKLSWDGYILGYYALNTDITSYKTSHEVHSISMSPCKASEHLQGVYAGENFKGVGYYIESWSHALGGMLTVSENGLLRVVSSIGGGGSTDRGISNSVKHSSSSSALVASDNLELAITTIGQEKSVKPYCIHLTKSYDFRGSCVLATVTSYEGAEGERNVVLFLHNLQTKRNEIGNVSLHIRGLAVKDLTGGSTSLNDSFITFSGAGPY